MRIAERSGNRVAERLRLLLAVAVRPLAARIELHLAHAALAAGQAEWNDDAINDLEALVVLADSDDLAHAFMAEHIAFFHFRDEAADQVQVRAADCARRDLDDCVPSILDPGIWHFVTTNVAATVINQRLHDELQIFEE